MSEHYQAALRLQPFTAADAARVASWVRSPDEAFMLAPGTSPPLTARKVIAWTARRGQGYMVHHTGESVPLGYAELNAMSTEPTHYWIGHVILDPARRGTGLGQALTHALCNYAREEKGATRLTLVVFPENAAAIGCYRACGFREVHQEFQCFQGHRYRLLRFERLAADVRPGGPAVEVAAPAANLAGSKQPVSRLR